MLSFKDIQIIETSIDSSQSLTRSNKDLAINKVSESLSDLLTSRFYNHLKDEMARLFSKEHLRSIKVRFSRSPEKFVIDNDYVKLKNDCLKLHITQQDLGSCADFFWRKKVKERLGRGLYPSDIFIAQHMSRTICHSFYQAANPLITLDDLRVNDSYAEAVRLLQDSNLKFFIDIEFSHFSIEVFGEAKLDNSSLNFEESANNYTRFDFAMVSI